MDKKYTVKDFVKKYNNEKSEEAKIDFVKSVINTKYIPYETKVTICKKIIESSYYIKTEINGIEVRKLQVNSPAQYMNYCLWLVKQYTNIEIDFKRSLEEFNELNKIGLFDVIATFIPEREYKELRMILEMTENDILRNEYETHAFISKQVERFGELIGVTMKPAIEQLIKTVENIDENKIEEIINKLNKRGVLNELKNKLSLK